MYCLLEYVYIYRLLEFVRCVIVYWNIRYVLFIGILDVSRLFAD